MSDVMEMVRFNLADSADAAALRAGAQAIEGWLSSQPGFVSRSLVGPDAAGRWTDLVRWRSLAEAQAAARQLPTLPEAGAFLALLDMGTVEMSHLPVLR